MTTAEASFVNAKTSVWWDIENCEVPKGWDAHAVAKNVQSALSKMNYCGIVSISAYGDTNLIPNAVQQALYSTGVGLNHVPAGVKDASDKKILVDMLLWAVDNSAPANFMLISGDRDFSNALHQLRMRGYNILLAQPPHASAPLVAAAKNVWLWTSLASGGPPLTSGESSQLVNNGHFHVSNKEVTKHPVSEQAQSSKPTDSTSDARDTKDHKTREKLFPRGSPQETRKHIHQNGGGATWESVTASRICNVVCDSSEKFTAHLSDKRHTSQAAFVDSRRASTSVSAKPIQEAVLVEPVVCNVCQISFTNNDSYEKHTYGKGHRNNLELLSGKSKNISGGLVEPSKEVPVKHKKNKKVMEGRAKANAYLTCLMCNVVCQRHDFDSHLRGQKHANMLSQSEALIDSKKLQEKGVGEKDPPSVAEPLLQSQKAQENTKCFAKLISMANQSEVLTDSKKLQEKGVEYKVQPRETTVQHIANANYLCRLCNVVCPSQIAFDSHLRGKKHAAKPNQSKALTDSKKLEEKGVGEKDQPRETIAEPQLHSQNAQENSKCFKTHDFMVNESDLDQEIINVTKLEEKDAREKAQPIEAITEPQSQSPDTQEHTKFFEKQNEELIKICGTSESSVKENFPSTKDQVETVNKQIPNGEFFFGDLRSDFKVPREARECFDGIVKPVNLSERANEHSGEVKKKEKELMVAFVGSDNAQSSVSTKPVKEPEDLQPVWCQVCQMSCNSKVAYANHTYGKKHRQNLELQSAKKEMSNGPAKLSKDSGEKTNKLPCKNQTTFDTHQKSRNHSAMVKEPAEQALVSSRRTRQEFNQEKLSAGNEKKEHTLVKIDDLGFRGAPEENVELKEVNAVSEILLHRVFPEQNRESLIAKEPRGCLDVIPVRAEVPPNVNVTKNLEDESKHKPERKVYEPKNVSTGCKEHPGEATTKREADNFWTRLWGKKG